MQAQAMHAAAANAAWNQSNNPYLSGLCFPYNLYGATAPQQLYAAYARLAAPLASSNMPDPDQQGCAVSERYPVTPVL